MAFPPVPEFADPIGLLDDTAFGHRTAASAAVMRNLARNGNRFRGMGGHMLHVIGEASSTIGDGTPGSIAGIGWPFWHRCTRNPLYLVRKKPGLTKLRVRVRAVISAGATVELQVTTRFRGFTDTPPAVSTITMVGTGVSAAYDTIIDSWDGEDEALAFYFRGRLDPDVDPYMDGLYGGLNTGTVDAIGAAAGENTDSFADENNRTGPHGPYNSTGTDQVHIGGHYIYFEAPSDGRTIHGPAVVVDVIRHGNIALDDGLGLLFSPGFHDWPARVEARGSTYHIRKLPEWRLISIAAYSKDEVPT